MEKLSECQNIGMQQSKTGAAKRESGSRQPYGAVFFVRLHKIGVDNIDKLL